MRPAASTERLFALGAAIALIAPGLALLGAPPHVPDESWRRPIALALLAAAAFAGPFLKRRTPTARGAILALLALMPAIAAAVNANASAYEASSAPVFVALAATILVASTVEGARGPATVLATLGLCGAAAALWVIADASLGRAAVGPFGRAGVAGPTLAALLVPAALLARTGRTRASRLVRAVPCTLVLIALVLVRSRAGALAAMAAVGAAAAALVPAPKRRRVVLALAAFAVVAVISVFLVARGALPGGDTLRVRAGLARASLALVERAPWLGAGPNGFAREVLEVRDAEEARLSRGGRPLAAHDDVLHVAAENGVPAAAAILALLGAVVVLAWRRAVGTSGHDVVPAASCLAIAVATSVAALAEDPLLSIAASLPFGLAAGLVSVRTSAPSRAWPAAASFATALAAATVLAWFAFATAAVPLAGDRVLTSWLAREGAASLDPATRAAADADLRARAAHARVDVHSALLYRVASGLAAEGRDDDAWRRLDRLLEIDPGATEARLDVAELHRRAGRAGDARTVLERARRADPTRFDVPLRLGHLALGDEPLPGTQAPLADPVAALRLYDEAVALDPSRFEGPVALARFHRRTGDLAAARHSLQRAKELGGLRGEVLLESFRLARAEGSPSEAATAILALALGASPGLGAEVEREAKRCLDAGDAEETRALEAAAAARSGADLARADALYGEATIRRSAILAAGLVARTTLRGEAAADAARGRHRRAVATFRAILADPFAREDPRIALAASSSAARFDAALSDALSARGRTLQAFDELDAGDLAAAARDFRAAIAKTPSLAAAHYGLARVLARSDADVEAVAELTRAIALSPDARTHADGEPDLERIRTRIPPPAPASPGPVPADAAVPPK